jgi:hypothetical protein
MLEDAQTNSTQCGGIVAMHRYGTVVKSSFSPHEIVVKRGPYTDSESIKHNMHEKAKAQHKYPSVLEVSI